MADQTYPPSPVTTTPARPVGDTPMTGADVDVAMVGFSALLVVGVIAAVIGRRLSK